MYVSQPEPKQLLCFEELDWERLQKSLKEFADFFNTLIKLKDMACLHLSWALESSPSISGVHTISAVLGHD
jgi:hypothetical protein